MIEGLLGTLNCQLQLTLTLGELKELGTGALERSPGRSCAWSPESVAVFLAVVGGGGG